MHSNNAFVSRVDDEKLLLCFLCTGSAEIAQRDAVLRRLDLYSWQDQDHRVLFEAIRALLGRNSQNILEHLPAELTRRGFPDISCDELAAPSALKSEAALALAEKLAGAS